MAIRVEAAGVLTTVQDLGRPHLRAAGFPPGGTADAIALRTANLLVGNVEDAAALECALVGPVLRFDAAADVAVTGARVAGVAADRRLRVRAGDRLTLSRFTTGAYACVAVAGGIDVPRIFGGRGTDVRLRFGGLEGRPLRAGDVLRVGAGRLPRDAIDLRIGAVCPIEADAPIRIVDGPDAACVPFDWVSTDYKISAQSDRTGLRLDGPPIELAADGPGESGVVFPGTVQLPGDGRPIVLLADAQTLGGYPRIASVVGVDLPRIAQRRPGEVVRFERVTLAEAHRLARRQARAMGFLRYGIGRTIGDNALDRSEL